MSYLMTLLVIYTAELNAFLSEVKCVYPYLESFPYAVPLVGICHNISQPAHYIIKRHISGEITV